jgi:HEAT repeat protein
VKGALQGPEMPALKTTQLIILFSAFLAGSTEPEQLQPVQTHFDELMHLIRTGNAYQRAEAISSFASIDDQRVVPVLMGLLEDQDDRVRVSAAHQLARLADTRSADALAKGLGNRGGNVRRYAAEGLAKIGSERHVPALVAAVMNHLPDPNTSDSESWHSAPALEAIGKLSSRAPPQIVELLGKISDESFVKDEDWWRLLEGVAKCLGQIGDKGAYDQLQEARKSLETTYQDYKMWYAVRKALADIEPEGSRFDRPAADILTTVRVFMASYEEIRQKWVQQLVDIGPSVIEDLEWTLRFKENRGDWDSERILVAITTLGQIGGPEATKVLRQYIERVLKQAAAEPRSTRGRAYPLRMAMLALLKAAPQKQTVEQILSLLPALDDFQQEYLMRDIFNAEAERIPPHIKVFLYSRILLGQEKAKSSGSYAPSAAAKLLGQIGGEEAGQALSEALLKCEDASVREAAARALGAIKDYDAIPPLIKAAALSGAPIAAIAAAMGTINDKRALPCLTTLQTRQDLRQTDRLCIAAGLARLGKDYDQNTAIVRKALPNSLELAQWLHDTETTKAVAVFVEDRQEYTRQRAISTLEAMGTKEAFDALTRFIDVERITDPRRLEELSAAVSRMAGELGDNSSKDYYAEIAAVSRAVRGWFQITAMAQPAPERRDTHELVKQQAALARKVWIAEASRRLDLAAKGEQEIWRCDIPGEAIRAVKDIFAPELVPVLRRVVHENHAKVSFHGTYKMVDFYLIRSLAAEILTDKMGTPYSFADADGRTHPGGWNPSQEQ